MPVSALWTLHRHPLGQLGPTEQEFSAELGMRNGVVFHPSIDGFLRYLEQCGRLVNVENDSVFAQRWR